MRAVIVEIPEALRGHLVVPLWPTAATLLGVSKNSAYAAAQRGEIPTVRLGSKWMVGVPALLELAGFTPTYEEST